MSYWAREVAGWLLVAIGLVIFYQSYDQLMRRRIFEAMPLAFIGFIVFRGGIHLLKVAVAAQAARGLGESPAGPAKRVRPVARPVGPTLPKAVLPGPQHAPSRAAE